MYMEQNKLFVAGFPWGYTNDTLREMFSKFGEVTEATVISDRNTGRSKGFGFVTFVKAEDAQKAMKELDGTEIEGRKIVVNVARPKEQKTF